MFTKLSRHVSDIAEERSLRFAFYRCLLIINRRIKLPRAYLVGRYTLDDELFLEPYISKFEGMVMLDVGANFGLWMKRLERYCRVIHAFEPNPETAAILKRNMGDRSNVVIHMCALGEFCGVKEFLIHRNLTNCGFVPRLESYEDKIVVSVRTIDSFNFERVDLIKIDTEGYEFPILQGASNTINRLHPQLFIEIHVDEHHEPIMRMLEDWGYRYKVHKVKRSQVQHTIITN